MAVITAAVMLSAPISLDHISVTAIQALLEMESRAQVCALIIEYNPHVRKYLILYQFLIYINII